MKRVKKGRSCYSIGGVVLDENQPITQPVVPQSQVSNFLASVRPDASTIGNSDLGFAASQSAQDGVHRGATAIQSPSSFSQSAGIIGGPRYEPLNPLDNGSNSLVGQSQGQQQLAPRGSFVDYMGGRLGNNNNAVSSLQAAAAEDANKRIKNILSGPYRYDRAGNKKYLGGNPYSPSLVAAATPSPLGYGEQDRANRRRTTGPPEPPRRGFRTAERWREGGDYPIDVKYADGGIVAFKGKGGPREDKIPVTVAGEKIMVSNGEKAVILPAKTAANRAAVQAINGIIQATNDGRKPSAGIEDGGKYQAGAYPYDGKRPPTAQEIYGEISPAGIAAALTPATWRAAKVVAPPGSVGGGMSSSGTDPRDIPEGGTITNLAPAFQQVTTPIRSAAGGIRSVAGGIGQVFSDSAQAQREGVSYQDIQVRKAREQASPPVAPRSAQQRSVDNTASTQQGIAQGVRPAQRPVMPADSSATQRNGLTTTQMNAGFDPTKLTMAPGYGMATNAAGKTISVGPSQYVAADGTPTSRWEDTRDYKDAIARNERNKIRLAEMQAVRLGSNPQQALQASQGIGQAAQQSGLAAQQAGQAQQVQQFAIDKAAREQFLVDAWNKAKTPEQKQEIAGQLSVLRGNSKERPEEFDNLIVKEYNDLGSVIGERVVQMPKNRAVQQNQAAQPNVLTKEMQAKIAPALQAQGMTLDQYARQYGLTIGK